MNEKRFIGSSGGVYDQYKSDRFAWSEWEEILQIMNNLNEKARERSKALSKLQKENEQLKKDCTTLVYSNQEYRQENENLKKQLDYIQNSINEHIKHQKTELGQKALREIIEDYNEWMLGHKELKE